jgi:hypothetical protein
VVAFSEIRPAFRASADEVAAVIEVPLSQLLSPGNCIRETRILHGEPVLVPFYAIDGHQVWGATAMVLSELLALIESERPHS